MKQIESRMDTTDSNHLVDKTILSGKMSQLSKDFQVFRDDIKRFSETLDQFQNAHIIIKRPDETTQG